ncbi:MAG: hypothetical protein CW338_04815, partial [Clostridiales bacterium]|nr:hypothetical protein [Clostridiales bacterium]
MIFGKLNSRTYTKQALLHPVKDGGRACFAGRQNGNASGEQYCCRVWNARIEQPGDVEKRLKYHPATDTFTEKDVVSLSYARGVPEAYGWIEESGTPPREHLDVIVMGDKHYVPGDREQVRIVGVYKRADGDHKLVGVTPDRPEQD